ncbi:hypothetical protein ET475_10850 [Microbacterium protaetiae]|uniref:Uncharacterized protein n=1 Tax=Microbacterium protaetiae TaxID=2509458 RepID=A0A4P6EF72_9MICO|nr:hypothetical protein [Microbacterium protaetiae]QAY60436.1 hypothetical protein ET475_10850 [Microbacterium protaetiae]
MSPQGISDLPDDPAEFPTSRLIHEFGLDQDEPTDGAVKVSMAERRVALADAKCRQSSGYLTTLYNAEWAAQAAFLHENEDMFADRLTEIKKFDDYATATINKLGAQR